LMRIKESGRVPDAAESSKMAPRRSPRVVADLKLHQYGRSETH